MSPDEIKLYSIIGFLLVSPAIAIIAVWLAEWEIRREFGLTKKEFDAIKREHGL